MRAPARERRESVPSFGQNAGSSHGATIELDTSYVEFGGTGVLEEVPLPRNQSRGGFSPRGSSHGATAELDTSYVELDRVGVLEKAAFAQESRIRQFFPKPRRVPRMSSCIRLRNAPLRRCLAQNLPNLRSVKLRLTPDRPFETMPKMRDRLRSQLQNLTVVASNLRGACAAVATSRRWARSVPRVRREIGFDVCRFGTVGSSNTAA